ncbi:MAG: hypothetical protein PHW01_04515 [Patescibacteria group bacterium]|nr:hypothetical protein [Patescibacteria group bacterium]
MIFKDLILADLAAKFAYLFLAISVLTYTKISLTKQKIEKDNRIPLKTFRNIDYEKINVAILVFLTLVLFQKVLVSQGQIEIGDISFPIQQERVLGNIWFLWNNDGSFTEGITTNIFPFVLINSLFNRLLHLSAELTIKLVISEVLFIGVLSLYFLGKKILKNFIKQKNYLELYSSFLVIFYIFNPYALSRISHFYHWIAYLFLPLILLIFIKLIEVQKARFAVILAFLLNFISFSPHYLVYASIMLGLFIIIEILNALLKNGLKGLNYSNFLKNIANIFICILCFILFSSHWLIPYVKTSFARNTPQTPGYMLTKEYIEKPKEKINPIIQTLNLNAKPTESKVLNLYFKILIFILPFILLIPLFPSLRNKYTIFFSILGIFAAIMSTMPIWHYNLYQKFLFDIPCLKNFGWLFRESSRINGLLALSYSFLLTFLFLRFFGTTYRKKIKEKIDLLSKKMRKKELKIKKLNSKIEKMKKKLQKVKNSTYA